MKTVILDSDTMGNDLDFSVLEEFGDVEVFNSSTPEEIKQRTCGKDVVLINKLKMNESTLGADTKIKLICVFATGFDNIDLNFCKEHGIAVCNVAGYSTTSVAQLTVLAALSLINRISTYNAHVRSGGYTLGGRANKLEPVYHEIAGMTWGITGYGNIGKAVGKVAEALGCKVIAFKRTPDKNTETVTLDELCERSDIISLHLPLSDATRGIIGEKQIEKMKDGAILVNMARGAVTDEKAVAEAVKRGKLGGFASDVYSVEPFQKEHPFYEIKDIDNVLLTPHMAWGAYEARVRCLDEICKNIRSFIAGQTRNRVDV